MNKTTTTARRRPGPGRPRKIHKDIDRLFERQRLVLQGGPAMFRRGDERDRLAIELGSVQRGHALKIAEAIVNLCTTLGAQR